MEDARAMRVATTRFSGRAFSAREVTLGREVVGDCSGLGRMELARTVCELLRWRRRPHGGLKAREWRDFLERFDAEGALVLPDRRPGARARFGYRRSPDGGRRGWAPARGQHGRCRASGGRAGARARRAAAVPGAGGPLPLSRAQGSLRCPPALSGVCVAAGAGGGGLLAVLEPAWRMAVRDRWVGWDDATRARNLQHVVNNSRFLLLPWVAVRNLASAVPARGRGRLAVDWPRHYHIEPWLVETLVDACRHHGGSHRAANWVALGATTGRGRMDRYGRRAGEAPKTVLVYPVIRDAQRRLRER